jgi:integrase
VKNRARSAAARLDHQNWCASLNPQPVTIKSCSDVSSPGASLAGFSARTSGAALRRRFKRTAQAAGLRSLKFHALRHGAGSLVARQADPRWVQGFLGHSKISTTERYLHAKARPEDVERLNRAFALRQPAEASLSEAAQ